MKPYTYKEFPRVVYGPNGETETIHSEDERPEGYLNSPKEHGAVPTKDAAAETAKKEAKEAEDKEREAIRKFLDENDVEYNKNLGIVKLRALSDELQKHLETTQVPGTNAGETPANPFQVSETGPNDNSE